MLSWLFSLFFFLIWGLFDLILFPSSLRCHGSRFSSTSKGFASSHSERQGVKSQKQTQRQTRCRCLETPGCPRCGCRGGRRTRLGLGCPAGVGVQCPGPRREGKKGEGGGRESGSGGFFLPPATARLRAEGFLPSLVSYPQVLSLSL